MDNLQTQSTQNAVTGNPQAIGQQKLLNTNNALQDTGAGGGQNLSALPRSGLAVIPNCTTNCAASQSQPIIDERQPWSTAQWIGWGLLFIIVFVVVYKLFSRERPIKIQPVAASGAAMPIAQKKADTKTPTPTPPSKKSAKKAKRKKRY